MKVNLEINIDSETMEKTYKFYNSDTKEEIDSIKVDKFDMYLNWMPTTFFHNIPLPKCSKCGHVKSLDPDEAEKWYKEYRENGGESVELYYES